MSRLESPSNQSDTASKTPSGSRRRTERSTTDRSDSRNTDTDRTALEYCVNNDLI